MRSSGGQSGHSAPAASYFLCKYSEDKGLHGYQKDTTKMTGQESNTLFSIRRGYSLPIPPSHISETIRLLVVKTEVIYAFIRTQEEYRRASRGFSTKITE